MFSRNIRDLGLSISISLNFSISKPPLSLFCQSPKFKIRKLESSFGCSPHVWYVSTFWGIYHLMSFNSIFPFLFSVPPEELLLLKHVCMEWGHSEHLSGFFKICTSGPCQQTTEGEPGMCLQEGKESSEYVQNTGRPWCKASPHHPETTF